MKRAFVLLLLLFVVAVVATTADTEVRDLEVGWLSFFSFFPFFLTPPTSLRKQRIAFCRSSILTCAACTA